MLFDSPGLVCQDPDGESVDRGTGSKGRRKRKRNKRKRKRKERKREKVTSSRIVQLALPSHNSAPLGRHGRLMLLKF